MFKSRKLIIAAAGAIALGGFAIAHADGHMEEEETFFEVKTGYGDTEDEAIAFAKARACQPGGAAGYRAIVENSECREAENEWNKKYICEVGFRCEPDF